MKRWPNICLLLASFVVLAALGGCVPEKRVTWSPNGELAAVINGTWDLYLADAHGKLSEPLGARVKSATWMPDSKRLVIVCEQSVKTWNELAALLDADQVSQLEALGDRLTADVVAHAGSFDDFDPPCLHGLSDEEKPAVALSARDRHTAVLREKLGDKWKDLEEWEATIQRLEVVQVDGIRLGGRSEIGRSLSAVRCVDVSPDGQVVAFIATALQRMSQDPGVPPVESERWALFVVPADGSRPPGTVVFGGVLSLDWSADGRYIAYTAASGPVTDERDRPQLGVVARRAVRAADGSLLAELPAPDEFAGLLFKEWFTARVRCLPDGRLVFAAVEVEFPCAAGDMPQRFSLFAVDPERSPLLQRLIPRQVEESVPDAVFFFEPSPDGTLVCLPGTEGQVAVLRLATGELWHVPQDEERATLRTLPTWRSNDELCCVVIPPGQGKESRPELALIKVPPETGPNPPDILSRDWPDSSVVGLLITDEELRARQRAASPAAEPATEKP